MDRRKRKKSSSKERPKSPSDTMAAQKAAEKPAQNVLEPIELCHACHNYKINAPMTSFMLNCACNKKICAVCFGLFSAARGCNPLMKCTLVTVLALTPLWAMAANDKRTVCTHDTQERVIELVYPTGDQLPCEVRYTKNGVTNVIWNAQSETQYCESKAAGFIENHFYSFQRILIRLPASQALGFIVDLYPEESLVDSFNRICLDTAA